MNSAAIEAVKNKTVSKPAFKHIQDSLISMIKKGKLPDGAKLPSESELCKQFNVSRMTVRHAIGKMEEKKQVYRVHGKGTFVSESLSAKNVNSGIIGLVMPGMSSNAPLEKKHSPSHYLAVAGIEAALHKGDNQYNTIMCRRNTSNMLFRINPEGVIVLYPKHVDIKLLEKFSKTEFPVVAVHCMFEIANITTVNIDIFKAGQMATEYLISKGKKNILFVGSDMFIQAETIHGEGYCQAMRDAGLKPVKCSVPTDAFHDVDLSKYIPLMDKYDGIIATDDYKAAAMKKILIQNDYKVPEDVEIVSYADMDYSIDPSLNVTTIFYSTKELVELSVETMLKHKDNPEVMTEHIKIAPKLIIK